MVDNSRGELDALEDRIGLHLRHIREIVDLVSRQLSRRSSIDCADDLPKPFIVFMSTKASYQVSTHSDVNLVITHQE